MPAPNSNGPPLDVTTVISTTLEAILYGFSVLMYLMTMWVLTRKKRRSELNVRDITLACLLFTLSTIHMGIDIARMFRGFVQLGDDSKKRTDFFGDVSQMTFVFKNAIYTLQTVLGDSVVIFRAYVVWQSVWPILLPSIILVGVAVGGIGSVYTVSLAHPSLPTPVFHEQLEKGGAWITAFFSSTLACNLIGTLTLAYRLWSLDRQVRSFRTDHRSPVRPILSICIDSGLLYSISLISVLILLVRGSRAQLIVLDMISPIISISFYAIILRVALVASQRTARTSYLPPTPSRPMFFASGTVGSNQSGTGSNQGHTRSVVRAQEYPLTPLNVKVVQTTKIDRELDLPTWSQGAKE